MYFFSLAGGHSFIEVYLFKWKK